MSVATATTREGQARTVAVATASRLAGIGGLVFVAILVVQNTLRAGAPGFNAAPAKVTAYFVHHRVAALVPLGLFPIGMLALFLFVAGVWTSSDRDGNDWWASIGALGAASIASLFAIVNISEIVLTAKAENLARSPDIVQTLWGLHGAAFGLDLAAIAVALIGRSRAALSSALIRAWIGAAVLPGAACLLIAAVFTVAFINGAAWVALGFVGFVGWLVFVAVASISLIRNWQIS